MKSNSLWRPVIIISLTTIIACGGFFSTWAFTKIESQDVEHAKIIKQMNLEFAKKDDLKQLSESINAGFGKIEKGFEKIDDSFTRFDELYARKVRVTSLYRMIDGRFDKTNGKIDRINEYLRDRK